MFSRLGAVRGVLAVSAVESKGDEMRDDLIEEVRAACRQAPAIAGVPVVIDEPYAPYIPPRWNGRLVVAEAQNLAGDTEYVRRLKAATPEDRISRLDRSASENLGIG